MANRPIDLGPTGRRVAENVAALRKSLGLDQRQLSERMKDLGRPMPPSVISKIENGDRRVDADDLMALALALDVTPNRLLLTNKADDEKIPLTDKAGIASKLAWRWAAGDYVLPDLWSDEPHVITEKRDVRYSEETRPQYPRRLDVNTILRHRDVLNGVVDAMAEAQAAGVHPQQSMEYVRRVSEGFPTYDIPKPKRTLAPGEKRRTLEEIVADLRAKPEAED